MAHREGHLQKKRHFLPTVVVGLFFLWDFYVGPAGAGVRIFDFGAVFILTVACIRRVYVRHEIAHMQSVSLSVGAVLFGVTAGLAIALLRGESSLTRPGVGLFMGALTLVLWALARFSKGELCYALKFSMWAAIIVQFLQVFVFYATDQLLSPPTIFGGEARINYNEFRPAGLFLEPANHCLTIISALSIVATFSRPKAALFFLTVLSIVLSKSLSGFLLLSALILLMPNLRAYCTRMTLPIILGLSLFGLDLFAGIQDIFVRITNLQTDGSYLHRFGIFAGDLAVTSHSDFASILFGHGLSGAGIATYGLNGIGFLAGGLGIILTTAWILYLILMSRLPQRTTLFLIFLLSLSSQIQTIMFFWMIIGIILFTPCKSSGRIKQKGLISSSQDNPGIATQ